MSCLRTYKTMKDLEQWARDKAHALQKEAWALYLKPRSPNEPHDERCQITRYKSDIYACTCKSNNIRRRRALRRAAHANDQIVLDTLGSFEASDWHRYRCEVDPNHRNPYDPSSR